MSKKYQFTAEDEGERIDVFLARETDNSRNFIQKLIEDGKVRVNDLDIKASYRIALDDEIEIIVPDTSIELIPENIPLDIIYEDDYIIIINKPVDMVVHPAPGNYTGTLANGLKYYTDKLSNINGELRPGIVHRLDKDTSGLLVIAKTNDAHIKISEQFKNREPLREYEAITRGIIKEDKFKIDAPIGRNPRNRTEMCVTDKNSKEAITYIETIKRYNVYEGFSHIKARLETGRTHQIRVHLAYIHNPIVGDLVYGAKKQKFNMDKQLLFSKKIGFNHPRTNEYMEFSIDYPKEFKEMLDKLESIEV